MMHRLQRFATTIVLLHSCAASRADDGKIDLAPALLFHASFDDTCDANVSCGDGWIYTAKSLARKEIQQGNARKDVTIARGAGRYGDALRFAGVSEQVLFYKADEIAYRERDWAGTVSFWLKLDPDKDLPAGYCDPIQLTQRKWNDAALFVDFDKDLPRDFRLGVFPDYKQWNPQDIPWEKIPADNRPLVTVKEPPFAKDRWTHVLFTFSHVNPAAPGPGRASLYLNGKLQGSLNQPMNFQWDVSKSAIMIGINYIGDFDDLAIFNRALTAAEVQYLYSMARGASTIGTARDQP